MSNRERAIELLNQIPEYKLTYIISYLEGAAIPDKIPASETLEAFYEIENGHGHNFSGTTDELFNELMED